jgi:hypothetical protein
VALTPISQIGKLALILGLMISALWAQDRETILYNFTGGADGGYPYYPAHLLQGTDGSIYGTTLYGGSKNCAPLGCGVVFRLSKSSGHWIENPIYSFTGGSDGYNPEYIIMDSKGNIYGLTVYSGTTCCGEVFKLALQPGGGWRFSVLHSFGGTTSDGSFPTTLVIDARITAKGLAAGLSSSFRPHRSVHGRRSSFTDSSPMRLMGPIPTGISSSIVLAISTEQLSTVVKAVPLVRMGVAQFLNFHRTRRVNGPKRCSTNFKDQTDITRNFCQSAVPEICTE